MNALYHLARADFLERIRRYSFFVTLAFSVYLGLAAATGQISLRLGAYTGIPNSAWVGTLMSMTTTVFLSLTGFYIVANSIQRDQQTRVGRILAATPMSRFAYTVAKAISNFAVLSAMVAVLAIAGIANILIRHTQPLELGPLLAPFAFIALPTMAIVAAVAVFFECTPILRRISAFAYFFLWVFCLAAATKSPTFDLTGMNLVSHNMTATLHALDPGYADGISFGFIAGPAGRAENQQPFLFSGIPWTLSMVLPRLIWFPAALVIALLPALWFHRFDPARFNPIGEGIKRLSKRKAAKHEQEIAKQSAADETQRRAATSHPSTLNSTLTVAQHQSSALRTYASLIACELRLLVARRKWWAYAISGSLLIASFAVPLDQARHALVAVIWLLPMLFWSRLGAREDFFATRVLVFSAPNAALRPLLASWFAGASLPLVLASGILVRLLLRGDFAGFIALVVGAFFVVALALAIGNLARTPKAFEAIYIGLWYVGLLEGIRGADFAGVASTSAQPGLFAALTLVLILTAWGIRKLRMRRA